MIPPKAVFVTGIHTDVGKTLVSAWLCLHWDACYWKPVQAGVEPQTDTEWVRRVTGLPEERFFPEAYRLAWPASPHAAAAREGKEILAGALQLPETERTLVVEGAGGLMVPLSDDLLVIDVLEGWKLPTVLVVQTYLGCINHALLSVEALRKRGIPLLGVVMNDGGRPESEGVILRGAGVPLLGRIPRMEGVSREGLLGIPLLG